MPVHIDNYIKIRTEREKRDIPVAPLEEQILAHDLLNKRIVKANGNDNNSQKHYIVEKVFKHWYCGWYLVLLVNRIDPDTKELLNTHTSIPWDNISCEDMTVKQIIDNVRETYKLVEEIN